MKYTGASKGFAGGGGYFATMAAGDGGSGAGGGAAEAGVGAIDAATCCPLDCGPGGAPDVTGLRLLDGIAPIWPLGREDGAAGGAPLTCGSLPGAFGDELGGGAGTSSSSDPDGPSSKSSSKLIPPPPSYEVLPP